MFDAIQLQRQIEDIDEYRSRSIDLEQVISKSELRSLNIVCTQLDEIREAYQHKIRVHTLRQSHIEQRHRNEDEFVSHYAYLFGKSEARALYNAPDKKLVRESYSNIVRTVAYTTFGVSTYLLSTTIGRLSLKAARSCFERSRCAYDVLKSRDEQKRLDAEWFSLLRNAEYHEAREEQRLKEVGVKPEVARVIIEKPEIPFFRTIEHLAEKYADI
jgi:hypothetical protein